MDFAIFIGLSIVLLGFQIWIGTTPFKLQLSKLLGEGFMRYFYRLIYIVISLAIFGFLLFSFVKLPLVVFFSLEDTVSNLWFLIIDTVRFIALFLIFEALWELELLEFTGLKQLWALLTRKKDTPFKTNRIRRERFSPKGLYLWHRQPILFYGLIFVLLDRSFSLNNLILLIIFIVYYQINSSLQEQRLIEDYGSSYLDYLKQVNKYLPMLKRYMINGPHKK